ncbi:MAG: hypothetical protein FWE90_00270 [Defluviitaleaceae bacterium]|nr:hypothetical protein [Defluviitaleaceae bacterium]
MWFDAQTAGLLGGILGGAMGVCGGIIGIMGGVLGRKGKYLKVLLVFAVVPIVIGVLLLPTGLIAFILRQPFHVWYPFALTGGIAIAVFLPLYFSLKKDARRYLN